MEFIKKHKNIIILSIIILLQVISLICFAEKKEYFHVDEVFSYGLMSSKDTFINGKINFQNNWNSGEYFNEYVTVSKDEAFDFKQVYINQTKDVHPPVYYFALNFISSFKLENFTKWSGIILNIIFFICANILLYKLCEKIFKNKNLPLIICFFWGFSIATITSVMLIRMYVLFTVNVLAFLLWNIKIHGKEKNTIFDYVILCALTIFGFLTHYYFIFIVVSTFIINFIHFLIQKKYIKTIKYSISFLLAGISSVVMYKALLLHIFKQYRGEEAISSFFNLSNYFDTIKEYIKIINRQLFANGLLYIIIFCLVCFIINCIKNKKIKIFSKNNYLINLLTATCVFYLLLVAKVAPYIVDRYVAPIYPLILIIVMYFIVNSLKCIFKSQKIIYSLLILFSITTSIIGLRNCNIEYLYTGEKDFFQPMYDKNSQNYVYVYEKDGDSWKTLYQLVRYKEFENIYNTYYEYIYSKTEEIFINKTDTIIYLPNDIDKNELIKKITLDTELKNYEEIIIGEDFSIYYMYK